MFKVISGGQTAAGRSPTDWRKLLQQLHALEKTLALRQHGGMGPRANVAFLSGVGVGLGVMVLFTWCR